MQQFEEVLRSHPWSASLTLGGREIAQSILDHGRWPRRLTPASQLDRVVDLMFSAFLTYVDEQERSKRFRIGRFKSQLNSFTSYSHNPSDFAKKHPTSTAELTELYIRFFREISDIRNDIRDKGVLESARLNSSAPSLSGTAYVVSHGAYERGSRTFVPRGMTVHLYTEVDTTLLRLHGLAAVSGQIAPWRSVTSPADGELALVENLLLAAGADDDIKSIQYLAMLSSRGVEGDVFIMGLRGIEGDWPNVKDLGIPGSSARLCTGACHRDKTARAKGRHTCDGLLHRLGHVRELHILACTDAYDTGFRRWLKKAMSTESTKTSSDKATIATKRESDSERELRKAIKDKQARIYDTMKGIRDKYGVKIHRDADGIPAYATFAQDMQKKGLSWQEKDRNKFLAVMGDLKTYIQELKEYSAIAKDLSLQMLTLDRLNDAENLRLKKLLAEGETISALSYLEELPQASQSMLSVSSGRTEAVQKAWEQVHAGAYVRAHLDELRDPDPHIWTAWRIPVWRQAFWEWMHGVGIEQGAVDAFGGQRLRMFELLDSWMRMNAGESHAAGSDLPGFERSATVTGAVTDIFYYGTSVGWDMSVYEELDAAESRLRTAKYLAEQYEARDKVDYETNVAVHEIELANAQEASGAGGDLALPKAPEVPSTLNNVRSMLTNVDNLENLFPQFADGYLPTSEEIAVVADAARKNLDTALEEFLFSLVEPVQNDYQLFLTHLVTLHSSR